MRSKKNNGSRDYRKDLSDRNLFVLHIPATWDDERLEREFSVFGEVVSVRVVRRSDGQSRGFGFVCFDDVSCAHRAIMEMNGKVVAGRKIDVSLKRSAEQFSDIQVDWLKNLEQTKASVLPERDCSLFILRVPEDWSCQDLKQYFSSYGDVVDARVQKRDDGIPGYFGVVTFEKPGQAASALEGSKDATVDGHYLKVRLKQPGMSYGPRVGLGCTLFVFHLPGEWSETDLYKEFSPYGKILNATIKHDSRGGRKGYGFVSYSEQTEARRAVEKMNGKSVGRKKLRVAIKKGEEGFLQVPAQSDGGFSDEMTRTSASSREGSEMASEGSQRSPMEGGSQRASMEGRLSIKGGHEEYEGRRTSAQTADASWRISRKTSGEEGYRRVSDGYGIPARTPSPLYSPPLSIPIMPVMATVYNGEGPQEGTPMFLYSKEQLTFSADTPKIGVPQQLYPYPSGYRTILMNGKPMTYSPPTNSPVALGTPIGMEAGMCLMTFM